MRKCEYRERERDFSLRVKVRNKTILFRYLPNGKFHLVPEVKNGRAKNTIASTNELNKILN
jgi:hypothetical protein